MAAEAVAAAMAYAIDQPEDVNVAEIVLRSSAQSRSGGIPQATPFKMILQPRREAALRVPKVRPKT